MNYPRMITAQMTNHEILGPAMEIESKSDADAYFEILVLAHMRMHETERAEAERKIRESIGYYAGYYDYDTRERVEKLFRCEHPVLGPIAFAKYLTPQEILERGIELGRKHRESMP